MKMGELVAGKRQKYLRLQSNRVDRPGLCGDMVDDMISKAPLVEESSRPSQVGNEAGQGELGPLHHLLAATDQRRVAWTMVTDHFCPVCFKSCTW